MKLISNAFSHEERIPRKYTCDGENINPELSFIDVPPNTKSLAIIMDDPDVPKHVRADGIWDHWIVFNIPPTITHIDEGTEPQGMHGIGTGNNTHYYGPCPPDREHRYFFNLYALDAMLSLPEKSTKAALLKAMQDHILAKAILIGLYERE